MKWISSLIACLHILFVAPVSADHKFMQLTAAEGVSILQNISEEEVFNLFCAFHYDGKLFSNYVERSNNCLKAVKLIEHRLSLVATGESSDALDLEFIDRLNKELLGGEGGVRVNPHHSSEFGLDLKDDSNLEEIIEYAKLINEKYKKIVYIFERCPSTKQLKELLEDISTFSNNTLNNWFLWLFGWKLDVEGPKALALRCLSFRDGNVIVPYKFIHLNDPFGSKEPNRPYPLHLMNGNLVIESIGHNIHSLSQDVLKDFLNDELTSINRNIEYQFFLNPDKLEIELVKHLRFIFLAHPFNDGNTRTFTVLRNMVRLLLGLPPKQSLLDVRDYSSKQIVEHTSERTVTGEME